ncbi:MAG TPA: alpha/beta hydrolase [Terriglobales bacterium]|nr:alpha/beta hydrolase [Terriglobales bacterium]
MPLASVNGLDMYYEIHGEGPPLVLLHGALSATGTSFGALLPDLARSRRVIAVEQQAHGRTADVDRPLTIEHMAEDTLALLRHLGVERPDLFGYSLGAGIALQIAVQHPDRVRRAVLASVTYDTSGFHPGLLDGIDALRPELLAGTPWQEEYARIAPIPDDWTTLVEKVKRLDASSQGWTAEQIRSIEVPVLLVIGDSDIVRPEHAVEMFRMLGGGVEGDSAGLPRCQLAVLPGTTHVTLVTRRPWLVSMVEGFLDR